MVRFDFVDSYICFVFLFLFVPTLFALLVHSILANLPSQPF